MSKVDAADRFAYRMRVILLSLLLVLAAGLMLTKVSAQETVDGLLYAPNVFYQEYHFDGEGNEFAAQEVVLQYSPDDNGVYQFSVSNGGTTIVFVYQLTEAGVIELAYYPETYESTDLRYHDDATDDLTSLVLPANLTVGQTFYRGYHGDEAYHVIGILPTFELLGVTYYDVIVLEPVTHPEGGEQRFYYAPQIGHIMDEWLFSEEGEAYPITTSLNYVRGPAPTLYE